MVNVAKVLIGTSKNGIKVFREVKDGACIITSYKPDKTLFKTIIKNSEQNLSNSRKLQLGSMDVNSASWTKVIDHIKGSVSNTCRTFDRNGNMLKFMHNVENGAQKFKQVVFDNITKIMQKTKETSNGIISVFHDLSGKGKKLIAAQTNGYILPNGAEVIGGFGRKGFYPARMFGETPQFYVNTAGGRIKQIHGLAHQAN